MNTTNSIGLGDARQSSELSDRRCAPKILQNVLLVTALLLPLAMLRPAVAQESTTTEATEDKESAAKQAQMEQFAALSKQLSGSKWVGRFSMDGKSGELKEETYEIQSVTKLPAKDLWLFKTRIAYGDHDVTVPLPLKVSWAGTTPMIVVDQVTVPGLGTFDARVLIAGKRYAGTWQHGDVGGHLFGEIQSKE